LYLTEILSDFETSSNGHFLLLIKYQFDN